MSDRGRTEKGTAVGGKAAFSAGGFGFGVSWELSANLPASRPADPAGELLSG